MSSLGTNIVQWVNILFCLTSIHVHDVQTFISMCGMVPFSPFIEWFGRPFTKCVMVEVFEILKRSVCAEITTL